MKYPLDEQGIKDIAEDIVQNHRAQMTLIGDLSELLRTAMECVSEEDADEHPWLDDANTLLSSLVSRRVEFENHRFNQKNGYNTTSRSPFPAAPHEHIGPIDIKKEAELNAHEAQEFGGEMSEAEIANLFRDKPAIKSIVKKKKKQPKLNKMSLSEIENWEAAQDNATDIYKVSARIKNAARMAVKANLTPQGDMIANTFTHVVKGIYDLADTVPDKEIRMKLTKFARSQEEGAAGLISALSSGVRAPT
jgi:hypothetical protein